MYNLQTAITLRGNLFIQQIFMAYPRYGRHIKGTVTKVGEEFVFIELTFSWGHTGSKEGSKEVKKVIPGYNKCR